MDKQSSNDSFLTWLVAIILALLLLIVWRNGYGPTHNCCAVSDTATAETDASSDAAPLSTSKVVEDATEPEPFSFKAACADMAYTGDASTIQWANNTDALQVTLCSNLNGEKNLSVSGDAQQVTIDGEINNAAGKADVEAALQAFFGEQVTINNQLAVMTPLAKVYFAMSSDTLPDGYSATLKPIIDWAAAHPDSKVVLSGYHDPTGNKAMNAELAKRRAQAVYAALNANGVAATQLEMRKPIETSVDGDLNEARRVEVSVE